MAGAAFLAFVGGVGAMMWTVLVTSIRQQAVPDRLLGRVSSAFRLFSLGAAPIGAALASVIAQVADVRAVFATAAVLSASLLVPFFAVVTNQMLAAGVRRLRTGSHPKWVMPHSPPPDSLGGRVLTVGMVGLHGRGSFHERS